MGLSCEINFPYNWAEEFYFGERLHLSVALKCHKERTVKGVALNVSYRSEEREIQSNQYSRYIDDQVIENRSQENRCRNHCSEIELFGKEDSVINMLPGTYIFDIECSLPEITNEECPTEENLPSFKFTVVVRKIPKTDLPSQSSVSASHLILLEPRKRTSFVWPGNFSQISNFSIASAIIGYHHVRNLEEPDNRRNYREENDGEDSLESWLDCILERPDAVVDDEVEEDGFPEEHDDESSKGDVGETNS